MFVFGKFGVLCFLETPVLKFALFPYYQRNAAAILTTLISFTGLGGAAGVSTVVMLL